MSVIAQVRRRVDELEGELRDEQRRRRELEDDVAELETCLSVALGRIDELADEQAELAAGGSQ